MRAALLATAIALVMPASAWADEITDQLDQARGYYDQGDLTGAISELEFVLQAMRGRIGQALLATFPPAPAGWTIDAADDEAQASIPFVTPGTMLSRTYRAPGGASTIEAQLMSGGAWRDRMAAQEQAPRGRTKADGAWKRVLTDLLPDVLAFAAPSSTRRSIGPCRPISLDKEFQAIARQAAVGPRVVDHLVQLRLRSGRHHLAGAARRGAGAAQDEFAARMYTYAALLHLRLWRRRRQRRGHPVESPPLILGLAMLTDRGSDWRPGAVQARGVRPGLRYDYWALRSLDWRRGARRTGGQRQPLRAGVGGLAGAAGGGAAHRRSPGRWRAPHTGNCGAAASAMWRGRRSSLSWSR